MTIFDAFGAIQQPNNDPETVAYIFHKIDSATVRYMPSEVALFEVDPDQPIEVEFRRMLCYAASIFDKRLNLPTMARSLRGSMGGRPKLEREISWPSHRSIQRNGEPGWYTMRGIPVSKVLEGIEPVHGKKAIDYTGATLTYLEVFDAV